MKIRDVVLGIFLGMCLFSGVRADDYKPIPTGHQDALFKPGTGRPNLFQLPYGTHADHCMVFEDGKYLYKDKDYEVIGSNTIKLIVPNNYSWISLECF